MIICNLLLHVSHSVTSQYLNMFHLLLQRWFRWWSFATCCYPYHTLWLVNIWTCSIYFCNSDSGDEQLQHVAICITHTLLHMYPTRISFFVEQIFFRRVRLCQAFNVRITYNWSKWVVCSICLQKGEFCYKQMQSFSDTKHTKKTPLLILLQVCRFSCLQRAMIYLIHQVDHTPHQHESWRVAVRMFVIHKRRGLTGKLTITHLKNDMTWLVATYILRELLHAIVERSQDRLWEAGCC